MESQVWSAEVLDVAPARSVPHEEGQAVNKLTDKQIGHFYEHGYLVAENIVPDRVLRDVIDELNAEVDRRARQLFDEGKLTQLYAEEGFETRLARISQETDKLALS